ncbi:Wzz/FepE/Etk N-terminal domain-containing protein [Chitinibacter sp. ZOR0017]|uniref:Wzz/FepE/Etk N-terminal domain-containing protein n=1 Tax=Chitinibacter sp. ZOR0017 TaxID=1339254 RepID=UPI000648834C|nr:Wzz/FepE/Etk N-terminal domain-containing protein [Chitinibacter sp. ZOR0017]
MAVEQIVANPPSDENSVFNLVLVLARHKKKIIGMPILAGLTAALFAYSLPDEYTATLKIAPSKNAATYNWVLTNEQVLEQVSKDLKLAEHYQTKTKKSTRKKMNDAVKVTLNTKDGFLDVAATDFSPDFAAKLANRMGVALQQNLYNLRLLDVSKQRYELETRRQLAIKNKVKLDEVIKQNKFVEVINQLSATDRYGITSLAAIQAETTLQGVGPASNNTSDMMQAELIRLQSQLTSLQRLVTEGMAKRAVGFDNAVWIAAVDNLQQQAYWNALIDRLDRRIELLNKQERDELKMTMAEIPDEKSGPKRALIVLLSSCSALFIVSIWAFASEMLIKLRAAEGSSNIIEQIIKAWKSR